MAIESAPNNRSADGNLIQEGDYVRHCGDESGSNMDGLVSRVYLTGMCDVFYSDSYDGPEQIHAKDLILA